MKTKVIFRTFRASGDTIALFPEIPADRHGDFCQSHPQGARSPMGTEFVSRTRQATEEEIAPLRAELEAIGYTELQTVHRVTFAMHRARRKEADRILVQASKNTAPEHIG